MSFFATFRDPWVTYLKVSVAKEGKMLAQKKLLQPLLGTPEGIYRGCTISFSTSKASAVHPNAHLFCQRIGDEAPDGQDGRGRRLAGKPNRLLVVLQVVLNSTRLFLVVVVVCTTRSWWLVVGGWDHQATHHLPCSHHLHPARPS